MNALVNLLGPTASYLFVGDLVEQVVPPVLLLGVGAVSYLLRPASRRLAESPSFGGSSALASGVAQ